MISVNYIEGSNFEAIASGMIGNGGVQKLASNTDMAGQPVVSEKETDLNLLRALRVLRGKKNL